MEENGCHLRFCREFDYFRNLVFTVYVTGLLIFFITHLIALEAIHISCASNHSIDCANNCDPCTVKMLSG